MPVTSATDDLRMFWCHGGIIDIGNGLVRVENGGEAEMMYVFYGKCWMMRNNCNVHK